MTREKGFETSLGDRFRSFVRDENLLSGKGSTLLGVSGGIDSMVMAALFLESLLPAAIAHCNFSLRGEESDRDEDLVRRFAALNNIPFHSVRFDTGEYASKKGISIQMAARELRYNWFEETRKTNGYGRIAVAHNSNDSIETMLINLVRGTGLTGLRGIRAVSGCIIRPLLFASRTDIEQYARQNNVEFREDASNSETKYTRNKIRHLVLPVLKEINPSVESTLAESAGRFSMLDDLLREYTLSVREKVLSASGNDFIINLERLSAYMRNRAMLFELFSSFGIGKERLQDLEALVKGRTGAYITTGEYRFIRNRGEIIITPEAAAGASEYRVEDPGGFEAVPFIESAALLTAGKSFKIPKGREYAALDASKVKYPLVFRRWKTGDYFYPYGQEGKKKISDFFTDRKYSLLRKERAWILESGGDIVWIAGERPDRRFCITGSTVQVLLLKAFQK